MFRAPIKVRKKCILQFGSIQPYSVGAEDGMLNATETAVCISFENLLVLQTLVFLPLLLR